MFISLFQTLHFISDQAITWLVKFLYILLKYCGRYSPQLNQVADMFPRSLYLRDKYLLSETHSIAFQKYVVCPVYHSLYTYEQCLQKTGTTTLPKSCFNLVQSKRCGESLLRQVVSISGSSRLYPFRVYCYHTIINAFQQLLLRKDFVNLCESTRTAYNADCLSDVFHGTVWKKFLEIDGQKFLSLPFTYGVTINIDWFEPFKHYTYSVGVIYLVVMNLPRSVRYKRKNIILVGVIPGPKEPSLTINTYLAPLVSELLQLWRGISFKIYGSITQQIVRVALLAVACDLPAGRKVCGFLSHSANLGCSRCYCSFAQGFGRRDYSNFDRDLWELRTSERHRKDISELSKCKTKTERANKESEIGCRFSELLRLPYFDPVNMLIIDPMHNLFLGSAKYITKEIWIKKGILNAASLDVIHERIKRVQVPVSIGRLPARIESGTTFTAEQWMNWTLYYSVYCLFGLLSTDMMELCISMQKTMQGKSYSR